MKTPSILQTKIFHETSGPRYVTKIAEERNYIYEFTNKNLINATNTWNSKESN